MSENKIFSDVWFSLRRFSLDSSSKLSLRFQCQAFSKKKYCPAGHNMRFLNDTDFKLVQKIDGI